MSRQSDVAIALILVATEPRFVFNTREHENAKARNSGSSLEITGGYKHIAGHVLLLIDSGLTLFRVSGKDFILTILNRIR
jgi:hypothetical protein